MRVQRIQALKDYIQVHETATIEELCQACDVSKSTLRRDLDVLAEEGFIEKVYGGVRYRDSSQLIPYENRGVLHAEAKSKIGRKAARLITDNDVVFLDSGTTTPYILESIEARNVTVITHSMSVLNAACGMPNISLFVLPGLYRGSTKSFCSTETVEVLRRYNITKAFMAASGFSLSGVTNSATWEYDIKKHVTHAAQQIYLCLDSSKFGITRMMTYCEPESLDAIISDEAPSAEWCEFLAQKEIRLIV